MGLFSRLKRILEFPRGSGPSVLKQEERIWTLLSELGEVDQRLVTGRRDLVSACQKALEIWLVGQVTALIVTRPKTTLSLSSTELTTLKREITTALDNKVSPHLYSGLENRGLWWHLERKDQSYRRVEIKNPCPTVLEIQETLFESAGLMLEILRRENFLTQADNIEMWEVNELNLMVDDLKFSLSIDGAVPFEWSKEMKISLWSYQRNVEAGRKVLKELRGVASQDVLEAWKAWEEA